jgi:hypothetical protein
VLDLPRSVLLALWGTAVLEGRAERERAVAVVTGQDEPHTVVGEDQPVSASLHGPGLHDLLDHLQGRAVSLRALLPAPGDALGLPPVPDAVQAAVDAGEAVVVAAAPGVVEGWTYVPQVGPFGSEHEPGFQVAWRGWRHPSGARVPAPAFGDLPEAERALRTALVQATEALHDLDVARWREDAADRIARLRDGGVDHRLLPPGTAPRAVRVIGTAARVRGIVEVAALDDGGSVSGWEASRRGDLLREIDGTARRALAAAASPQVGPG